MVGRQARDSGAAWVGAAAWGCACRGGRALVVGLGDGRSVCCLDFLRPKVAGYWVHCTTEKFFLSAKGREGTRRTATATSSLSTKGHEGTRRTATAASFCPRRGAKGREERRRLLLLCPRRATKEHEELQRQLLFVREGARRDAKNGDGYFFFVHEGPRRNTKNCNGSFFLSAKGREGARRTATATPFVHEGPRRNTKNCNGNILLFAKGREEHLVFLRRARFGGCGLGDGGQWREGFVLGDGGGRARRGAVHFWGESGQAQGLPLPWSRRTVWRHDVGGRPVVQTVRRRRGANVAWCMGGVAGGVPPHKGGPKARPHNGSGQWLVVSGERVLSRWFRFRACGSRRGGRCGCIGGWRRCRAVCGGGS